MKLLQTFAIGCSLVSVSIAVAVQPTTRDESAHRQFVPGGYIVELNDGEVLDDFLDDLRSTGLRVKGRRRLSTRFFHGLSFEVLESNEPDHILRKRIALPEKTKNVWPIHLIPSPQHEVIMTSQGNLRQELRKRDYNNSSPQHVATQIDKLHEAGYTGKGIKIGIIDTGVDYKHPALGGCFGEGCLISYGADLVGANHDWDNPAVEDDDPMEDGNCFGSYGHGTHVTGVVAAQPNEYGFVGVAPDATIGFYKICGGLPYPADIAVDAIARAAEDGSDVITFAVGLTSTSPNDPAAMIATRVAESGIPVVISASNAAGFSAYWTVTSPCVGGLVTCVGSSVPDELPMILLEGTFTIGDGPEQKYGRMATYGSGIAAGPNPPADFSENITLPLWDADLELGGEDAACNPVPDDLDLSEYLVLVGTFDFWGIRGAGPCSTPTMIANLAERGAKNFMLYFRKVGSSKTARAPVPEGVSYGFISGPIVGVWRDALAEGDNVTVSITAADSAREYLEYVPNDDNPGAVAAYSSWGPGGELDVKPQIVAPGDFVLSTYPVDAGGYSVIGGTSFSGPMAAGLFALVMQARGTKDTIELNSVITGTAKNIPWFNNKEFEEFPAPVAQQGTGLMQGWDAFQATTTLDRFSFSFNDSVSFKCQHEFTIHNSADEEVTYQISHLEGRTGYALPEEEGGVVDNPLTIDLMDAPAKLSFKPQTVTLGPGEKAKIKVRGSAPKGLDADRMPVYGGWVIVESDNNETLSLPYTGLAGGLGAAPAILSGLEGGTWLGVVGGGEAEANTTFTLPRPDENNIVSGYIGARPGDPQYYVLPRTVPPILRIDVVTLEDVDSPTEDHLGYKSLGTPIDLLGPFPVYYPPRAPFSSRFYGMVWPGVAIPEGRYQLVVSALRKYGDEDNVDDWDVVELPSFTLKYSDE